MPFPVHVKLLALQKFRASSAPPSGDELAAFAQQYQQEDLSLTELVSYLRTAIETAQKQDADRQRAFAEKEEKRAHARETLRGVLRTYKGTRQIIVARRVLWDAVESAREAFRFAFAAERKNLTRNLGGTPAALAAEAVISLDRA